VKLRGAGALLVWVACAQHGTLHAGPSRDGAVRDGATQAGAGQAGAGQEPASAAGFDAALRETAVGRFPAALAAAEAEPDPLRRAQARLWVRHHAGDLDGALAAARAAREASIADAWLIERELYVALSLRRAGEARAASEALERELARAGPAADARIAAQAAGLRAELETLERSLGERAQALARARGVSAGLGCSLLLVLAWLAFRTGRARPST
jgi:hypothetical protein